MPSPHLRTLLYVLPTAAAVVAALLLVRVLESSKTKPGDHLVPGASSIDDLDPSIEYDGAWTHDRQFADSYNSSISYSDRPGNSVRLTFHGSSITYVYTMALNRGIAQVLIDGTELARIDLYSAKTQWQQQKTFDQLGESNHTIEIRVTDQKDPHSSALFVDVDRFIVGSGK